MKIKINKIEEDINKNTSLANLVEQKKIDLEGIAIAINENIIPKIKWKETILKENDRILIITATRGG